MDRKVGMSDDRIVYQIKIDGKLDAKWAQWLSERIVKIQDCSEQTTILVEAPDQAALRGTLNRLWDLNLTLVSVTQHGNAEHVGGPYEC
jgi:hypothetical protein